MTAVCACGRRRLRWPGPGRWVCGRCRSDRKRAAELKRHTGTGQHRGPKVRRSENLAPADTMAVLALRAWLKAPLFPERRRAE